MATVPGPEPDWLEVHRELKRKGVTLRLLWDEYKALDCRTPNEYLSRSSMLPDPASQSSERS